MRFVLSSIAILIATVGIGQIQFYKQFSNNGYDYGKGIYQLKDSSYLVTGVSSSFTDGAADAFLLKVDSLGAFQWSKHYGGVESDGGTRVKAIEDYCIYIGGYTNSEGNGAYDFMLIKTDMNGNENWRKTYGTDRWEQITDMALTKDSGLVIVGESTNSPDNLSDVYIVRVDKNGDVIWENQIQKPGKDWATCVKTVDSVEYFIGGSKYIEDSMLNKSFVMNINVDGTINWEDTLGSYGDHVINDMVLYNSNVYLAGYFIANSGDTSAVHTILDQNGNLIHESPDPIAGKEVGVGLARFGANDFAAVTLIDNSGSYGKEDLAVFKYHGFLGWLGNLSGVRYAGSDVLGEIITTNDSGVILAGSVEQVGVGGSNIYLLKLHPDGTYIDSNDDFATESLVNLDEVEVGEWSVFPNPSSNYLNIRGEGDVLLTFYDATGQEIAVCNHVNVSKIDISNWENGLYLIKINEGQKVVRIIKN